MKNRLEKLLGISGVEAEALAVLIDEKLAAITDESLSKKKKLRLVLKDMGWSKKEISHFVYGPTKRKPSIASDSGFSQNSYNSNKNGKLYSRGKPPMKGGAPSLGKTR